MGTDVTILLLCTHAAPAAAEVILVCTYRHVTALGWPPDRLLYSCPSMQMNAEQHVPDEATEIPITEPCVWPLKACK